MKIVSVLACSVALLLGAMIVPAQAQTLPSGYSLVYGSVTVAPADHVRGVLAVKQTSATAIVNFDDVSVGPNGTLEISQPSADSWLLLRVVTNSPSYIDGAIHANGHVVIVNQAGITVSGPATVDAGGIVLSSLNAPYEQFVAGDPTFEADSVTGVVVNRGAIHAPAGIVAMLSSGDVTNEGTVEADHGVVGLVSSSRVALTPGARPSDVIVPARAPGGLPPTRSWNWGILDARGGAVLMHTDRADPGNASYGSYYAWVLATVSTLSANSFSVRGMQLGTLEVTCRLDGSLNATVMLDGTVRRPDDVTVIGGVSYSSTRLIATRQAQKVLQVNALQASGPPADAFGSTSCSASVLDTPHPRVSGSPKVGHRLRATGAWGPNPVHLAYRWLRGGAPVAGATGPTYTARPADRGHQLSVRVTGSRPGYESAARTSGTVRIGAGTLSATPRPKVKGRPKVGRRLTVKAGHWAPGPVRLSYQWRRGSHRIRGATTVHYKTRRSDAGHRITVRVTGSKRGYTAITRTSRPRRVTR